MSTETSCMPFLCSFESFCFEPSFACGTPSSFRVPWTAKGRFRNLRLLSSQVPRLSPAARRSPSLAKLACSASLIGSLGAACSSILYHGSCALESRSIAQAWVLIQLAVGYLFDLPPCQVVPNHLPKLAPELQAPLCSLLLSRQLPPLFHSFCRPLRLVWARSQVMRSRSSGSLSCAGHMADY